MLSVNLSKAWWGPPRKFNTEQKNRRVSWLELFFDLVYVVAVSKTTHHFANNITWNGFVEYACFFVLIYWGWLNGSLHHDLHGNQGLRTRLLTLWQILIIAALAIELDKSAHHHFTGITIVLMIMQGFITYLWWSVGFYDKNHRRYSWPYTLFYLLSLGIMGLSLLLHDDYLWLLLPATFIFNYIPPFISHQLLKRSGERLDLSSSMFERLGLFTIIVFGELMLNIIDAIVAIPSLNASAWVNFVLAIGLIFALWWIFFTMIARREAKKNFARASLLEVLYIPALIALGCLAAGFPAFFRSSEATVMQGLFNYAISVFLMVMSLMIGLLVFPEEFSNIIVPMRLTILAAGLAFLLAALLKPALSPTLYLLLADLLIGAEIIYLNFVYYRELARRGMQPSEDQA